MTTKTAEFVCRQLILICGINLLIRKSDTKLNESDRRLPDSSRVFNQEVFYKGGPKPATCQIRERLQHLLNYRNNLINWLPQLMR